MKKKRSRIALKLKKEILAELSKPGCVVSNLAKTYEISTKTLYVWRRAIGITQQTKKADDKLGGQFVELTVEKAKEQEVGVEKEAGVILLKKCELVFSDFSILIEGKFSSSKLFEVVKILEASC